MTYTPESDKAKIAFTSLFANDDAYLIPYTVGIKLERERDEARNALRTGGMLDIIDRAAHDRARAIRERDEAREELAAASVELCDFEDAIAKWMKEAMKFKGERDRLAEALKQCREDSVELLGERDWWQNETRLDYQKRYRDTRDNIDRADDALQSLTPNEP